MKGLIWLVLAEPLAALLVAWLYTRRLPTPNPGSPTFGELLKRWWPMVRLGLAFMLGGLLTTVTLLLVRTLITREIGLDAAGQFAAAWTVTMIYVGFLLDAMGKDYYPRLSEVIEDRAASTRLMNDQMFLALALGGPILLLMIGLAPWVTMLLYSEKFDSAASLIQWQMAGNVFKIASWVLSFSFIAAGRGGIFLGLEFIFNLCFFGIIFLGLPAVGLDITGIGFLVAYIAYFFVVMIFANWMSGFRWQSEPLRFFTLHAIMALSLLAVARTDQSAGVAVSIILSAATAFIGLRAVISRSGQQGRIMTRIARAYEILGWPIGSNK
jgi:PST family polysaccharide transporter